MNYEKCCHCYLIKNNVNKLSVCDHVKFSGPRKLKYGLNIIRVGGCLSPLQMLLPTVNDH